MSPMFCSINKLSLMFSDFTSIKNFFAPENGGMVGGGGGGVGGAVAPPPPFSRLLYNFGILTHLLIIKYFPYRSSRLEVFCKKGVLRIFTKFTGKDLYQSLFFNKVAGLTPTIL